ncbi:MAG: 50S ribosomal protein L17 [Phycisphaerales bacterium]|nr:50S ribosomal protein L17 [Phycisphaerales bacterium]MCB9854828.1 50S ribosomal protein L17 [Phycisphaerales bacterium]
MRHRVAKKHLSRTASHLNAMRRNMAQSLIEHGQVETTLPKARETRRFVEKLITVARKGTIDARRRVESMLRDRAIIDAEHQEKYDQMTDAQRHKVMFARSGRRHRTGAVPASYNKNKIPFVAQSVIHKLMTEIAPNYKDRPGGYTRIIRTAKRRIGDNGEVAILQLVDPNEQPATGGKKKSVGLRRERINARIAYLEGKKPRRKAGAKSSAAPRKVETSDDAGRSGDEA